MGFTFRQVLASKLVKDFDFIKKQSTSLWTRKPAQDARP